ncbi:ferritin family protein [Chloroflexota bacterium]
MAEDLTIGDILEKAICKEIEAQVLYKDISRRINNPAEREAFQELEKQERGHQEHLERYLRGELKEGGLSNVQVIDYKIAEKLEQAQISPDMALEDAFLLAAQREKTAHEFYIGLAEIHLPGDIKKLLQELAEQELEHKQRVEYLYTEVAFPQTDGG